jgi:hypothetical protein
MRRTTSITEVWWCYVEAVIRYGQVVRFPEVGGLPMQRRATRKMLECLEESLERDD